MQTQAISSTGERKYRSTFQTISRLVFWELELNESFQFPAVLKMNQSQGDERGGPTKTLPRLANWGVPKLSGNWGVPELSGNWGVPKSSGNWVVLKLSGT